MLLNALSFSSCSPQRHLARTQEHRESSSQEHFAAEGQLTRDSAFFRHLYEALREQLEIEQTRDRATSEAVETVTREYDTSRPVDTLTGKPPLLRETTQRRHRTDSVRDASRLRQTQTRDRHEVSQGASHEDEQMQLRGEHAGQSTVDTTAATESRRGLTGWQKALCFVGLLTLLYLIYKVFNNH